jgi:heat-inducible transcriptional repressor
MELSERKKRILNAIVEEYILTGEPVGSKFLANKTDINLSSATIRNEMAELTELGLITQPHTSAGRVPTHSGYRIYVDKLMENYSLTDKERKAFDELAKICSGDIESILEKAGNLLADITGCTAVSTVQDNKSAVIKRAEIRPAGRRTMLLVILTSSGVIRSRLCRVKEDLTLDMVTFFSNFVKDNFCGKTVESVTPQFIDSLKHELFEYTYALSPVLDIIADEIKMSNNEVFIGGAENLLTHSEFDNENIIKFMKLFEHTDELLRLIGGISGGVNIRIGEESGMPFMSNSAIIAAPYAFKGNPCGTVGIIGPSRINYAKMVSNIEYLSSVLSRILYENFGD